MTIKVKTTHREEPYDHFEATDIRRGTDGNQLLVGTYVQKEMRWENIERRYNFTNVVWYEE